jgi:hypothetical protein
VDTVICFKSQKRVFSLGFEKSHSFCCAAGVEGERIVDVAAGGVAVFCIGLEGSDEVRAIFPTRRKAGNGPMGSRGAAFRESCFLPATFYLARTHQVPTLGSLSKKCNQSHL